MAAKLTASIAEVDVFVHRDVTAQQPVKTFDNIIELTDNIFGGYQGLVYIMPCGVAVRAIAPKIQSKLTDPAVIVVDKPCGLIVHPHKKGFHQSLVNALIYQNKVLSTVNAQRPGVVHRLDKETSGVIVLAKTNAAHLNLINQFKERSVKKQYRAICKGKIEKDKSTFFPTDCSS